MGEVGIGNFLILFCPDFVVAEFESAVGNNPFSGQNIFRPYNVADEVDSARNGPDKLLGWVDCQF